MSSQCVCRSYSRCTCESVEKIMLQVCPRHYYRQPTPLLQAAYTTITGECGEDHVDAKTFLLFSRFGRLTAR